MTEPVVLPSEHVPNYERIEPGALVFIDDPYATGFTDKQIAYLLSGGDDAATLVAAGTAPAPAPGDDEEPEPQTGAMIALIPSEADAARLALSGGEAADQLHLTVLYLGEAASLDDATRARLLELMQGMAAEVSAIPANAFGCAILNPTGDQPCLVLNVGGEDLDDEVDDLIGAVDEDGIAYPPQHQPYLAHVTLAYTDDPRPLITDALYAQLGPLTFDRIRLAFAGDVTDLPLTGSAPEEPEMPGDDEMPEPGDMPGMAAAGFSGPVTGDYAGAQPAEEAIVTAPATQTVPLAVGPSVTGNEYADLSAMTGAPWEGVLAVEGTPTGDGRQFAEGALTWVTDGSTIPLRWNIVDSHGGTPTTQTVLVGRIDEIWRDGALIRGRGVMDSEGQYGAEAVRQMQGGYLSGVSIDPDSISDADVELVYPEIDDGMVDERDIMDALFAPPELTIFHAGRIRAATMTDIPAFVEAQIHLVDAAQMAPAPVVAATARGSHFTRELSNETWVGATQETRLRHGLTVARARAAFAHVQMGQGRMPQLRFMHHEVDEHGTPGRANLTAVHAALRSLSSGRADTLTAQERHDAYLHLATHLRAAGMVPPAFEETATLVAGAFSHLVAPPAEWFADPQLPEVTPLTVTDEGRVFGHGAGWGTCHTAFPGACVTPPVEGEHLYYRTGEVVTADGGRIPVGTITLGTGHAATLRITPAQAVQHYDHTGTAVALVASGEDSHGIWVAGALRPDVTPERVVELRAAGLSGDWRRIAGQLRLVAFLAVNHGGFPIPRTAAFMHAGAQQSLVAAGIVTQDMRQVGGDGARSALKRIARSIGRDPDSRWAELQRRMGKE